MLLERTRIEHLRQLTQRKGPARCGQLTDRIGPDGLYIPCGEPAPYAFRLAFWPEFTVACSCAEHAHTVRTWPLLERIWTL